jgi:hypothetical protein
MATQAEKFVALREQFEATALTLKTQRGFLSEREERQAIGRYQTLESVAQHMAAINANMKSSQVQQVIEGILDQLGSAKATGIVNCIRERRKYGINELGEWMTEGAIAQINEIIVQFFALLPPKWHTAGTAKHGRFFHVYHGQDLDALRDTEIGKQHWFSPERAQWYQEVAIIEVKQPEQQLEEVYRLTNHIDRDGWHQNREVLWRRKISTDELNQAPRSTSTGDILVSVLSGFAWITASLGFEPLVPQKPATRRAGCRNVGETLEERDGWLYIRDIHVSFTEPKEIATWWPLQVRFADFAQRFGSREEARLRIGHTVIHEGNGLYRDDKGLRYRLVNGGQTTPEFTEVTDIAPPKQHGRKLPIEWRNGSWYKQTSQGWKRA